MNGREDLDRSADLGERVNRLAAIGEKLVGLAHDGRHSVHLSKLSLELLKRLVTQNTDALQAIHVIEQAQDDLGHLYDEVCQFVSPTSRQCERVALKESLVEGWSEANAENSEACISLCADVADLACELDRFAMRRVWTNIFRNAIQVSPRGSSVLVQGTETVLRGRPAARVIIRDQGPGLTREQREQIFTPFFTTRRGGTGLGMAIVLRLIEEHGGTVSVADRNGPGAEVEVVLPLADHAAQALRDVPVEQRSSARTCCLANPRRSAPDCAVAQVGSGAFAEGEPRNN